MEVLELVQLKEQELRLKNKMTEKDYNPEQRNKKTMEKQKVVNQTAGAKSEPAKKTLKEKVDEKKEKAKPVGPKKTEAVVSGKSLSMSTKKSIAVCKFIKGKKIQKAISDLEQVLVHKQVVPMKGEIPHKKGVGISSGGYPKKAVDYFIKLLKSLQSNANANGLSEPVIVEAIANMASRPYGKFGRVRRKRTHVMIKVKEHRSVYPKTLNKGAKK